MATKKVIVEGSSVTASQMKDFWRQASEGAIDAGYMQAILSASRERREMFVEGREFKELATIQIDRSKPFDPAFLGEGWRVIREEDDRSLAITELALESVKLIPPSSMRRGMNNKLYHLKELGHIRLDAKIFQTLWENQELIPAKWKEWVGGKLTLIFFDGTVFEHPQGDKLGSSSGHIICLYWNGTKWCWDSSYDEYECFEDCFSAVVPVG